MLSLLSNYLLCVQFGIFYTYVTELFDTRSRSLALGVTLLIAKSLNGTGTYIILFFENLKLNPLCVNLLLCCMCVPSLILLPETRNRQILN